MSHLVHLTEEEKDSQINVEDVTDVTSMSCR